MNHYVAINSSILKKDFSQEGKQGCGWDAEGEMPHI